jgi:uncharacterized membrane protein YgcG
MFVRRPANTLNLLLIQSAANAVVCEIDTRRRFPAGVPALRRTVSQLHPTDYVNDFAHVLDPGTIAQLDNLCLQIEQKAHAQIAIVTVNSLDGSDIESYAVDLYKKWGVGSKATEK